MSHPPSTAGWDFIGRMIDKAFDRGNALEPRLPSLYEPSPGIGLPIDAEMGAPIDLDIEAQPSVRESAFVLTTTNPPAVTAEAHRTPANVAAQPGEHKQAAAREPDTHAMEQRVPPLISPMVPSIKAPSRAASTQLDYDVLARRHSKSTMKSRDKAMSDPQPAEEIPVVQRAITVTANPATPLVFAVGDKKIDWVQSTHKAQEDTTRPPNSTANQNEMTALLAPVPQRIRVEPSTSLHRRSRAEPRNERPESASESVVNVTIGRVEIRANQALLPVLRQQGEAHGPRPLSLNEYLKERSGRR